ncbi:MAG: polysaccharide biosynthesis C-terminal domain-containing protein, partial [Ignavibacteriaceae bacterium]|nr:polysaccharide biosynthesis C-terminal domain-containing protein [Ignavibacteriaceae bacterium]
MEKGKFSSTIAGASIILTLATLASKGLGFFREVLFANYFGLGSEFDIYLVGAALPITLNTIIFFIAQNYLIPIYHKKKTEYSEHSANSFIAINVLIFFIVSLLFSLVLYGFSYQIVSGYLGGVSDNIINTARDIFLLFLLTIPLQATFSVFANFLFAKYEYKHPALSNILVNAIVIIVIIFEHDHLGIYSIAAGFIGGNILQLIYIYAFSRRHLTIKKINFNDLNFKNINSSFLMIILIEAMSQLFILTDRYFYAEVEQGGISAINYASTLYVLPISILAAGLSTALFPKFSAAFAEKDKNLLASYLTEGLLNNILMFVPITVFIFFNCDLIVSVIFQRGKFTSINTLLTGDILKIFSLSLVFYSSYAIINKFLYATNLLNQLVKLSFLALVIKIVLNFLLVEKFMQNGLAWSSTISYSSMGILGIYYSIKLIDKKIIFVVLRNLSLFLILSLLCFWVTLEFFSL